MHAFKPRTGLLSGYILLAACLMVSHDTPAESTFDKLVHAINLTLQETNDRAQIGRILVANQKSLTELTRVDVAAGIRRKDLDALLPDVIARANASNGLKDAKVTLLQGTLTPKAQELDAVITLKKVFPEAELTANVTAQAAVAASGDRIFLALFFNRLVVTDVRVTKESFSADALASLLSAGLKDVLPLLNVVFDREINRKRAFAVQISIPPLYSKNLKDESSPTLSFDQRQIDIFATIVHSAVYTSPDGLVVLAAAENKKPLVSPSDFPNVDDPTALTSSQLQAALAKYQSDFLARYKAAFGADAPRESKSGFLLVSRIYAATTLNGSLKPPAICVRGSLTDKSHFSFPVTFPSTTERQCGDITNSCHYQDLCRNTQACKKTITDLEDVTEKVADALDPTKFVTKIVKKQVSHVVDDLSSQACSDFAQTKRVNPNICRAASNLDKAKCDAITAADVAFCQGEDVMRKFIMANPVAIIDGDIAPNVRFDACASDIYLSSNFDALNVTVAGHAKGPVSVRLGFTNTVPPGTGLCAADWADSFSFNGSTTVAKTALTFAITAQPGQDDLDLVFAAGAQDLSLDISPAPLDALFVRHPHLAVNCSPMMGLAATYITYDTAVNESAKKASPILTGKGYSVSADANFRIRVPKLDVKDINGKVLFSLYPGWQPKDLAFETRDPMVPGKAAH